MSVHGCQFESKCDVSLRFNFLPLASILLTPKNADRRHLSHRRPTMQQGAKIAIVNPARERDPEKLEEMVKFIRDFSAVWLFPVPWSWSHRGELFNFVLIWFHNYCTFWKHQAHTPTNKWSQIKRLITIKMSSLEVTWRRSSVHLNSSVNLNQQDLISAR